MLLFASGEDYLAGFAIDVPADGSAPRLPVLARPAEIDLHSVHFTCPLDVLGMREGRLSLAGAGPRPRLPQAASALASHDGSEQTPWEAADPAEVDRLLRSVDLPEDNLCRLYGVQLGPLAPSFVVGTSTPTALIPLPGGKALVANADRTFYEVDADRNARRISALDGAPNRAGFRADDGTLWLVDHVGTIARGNLDGFEIVQTGGATISEFTLVDGARHGPVELYRTSAGGPLERFGEDGWKRLTAGGARTLEDGIYSVAWVGPNHAIATGSTRGTSAIRYRDGTLIEVPMPGSERPFAIAHLPGIGAVIGTHRGEIIRERDERLEVDSESRIEGFVRTIVPTERGFFYGRTRWASWDPVAGYCTTDVSSADGTRMVPLGDRGFLAIGDLFSRSFLFTLDRVDVEHSCLGK